MSKLFIRSQNKKMIEQVSSVNMYDKYEGNPNNFNGYEGQKYVGSYIEVNGKYFGTYKTTERAMQVLDEIQNTLLGLNKMLVTPKVTPIKQKDEEPIEKQINKKTIINSNNLDIQPINQGCVVYQMPQE